MLNIKIKRNQYHIFVWVCVIVYLFFAPNLYYFIFQKNGKPIQIENNLPTQTIPNYYRVDRLDPQEIDGQEVFVLWGWAFLHSDDPIIIQGCFERVLVIEGDKGNYLFSSEPFERPGVQEAFEYLGRDLIFSGFTTIIAKEAIPQGVFKIGIIFKNIKTGESYYISTNKVIVRTPNTIMLDFEDSIGD